MDLKLQLGRIRDWLLHFGAYPEETLEQRAKRRLYLGITWLATALTAPVVLEDLGAGLYWIAVINAVGVAPRPRQTLGDLTPSEKLAAAMQ